MSEHKYTEEEYADMIQCYLTSDEDLNLTQICYEKRYPGRKKPLIETLEEVIETYLEALESTNSANPEEDMTQPNSKKEDSIVQYFINNPHATIKKAASIFGELPSYIENLLAKRKVEIEAKPNEDEEIIREEESLNDYLKQNWKTKETTATKVKQERSNSVDEIVIIDEFDSEESDVERIIGNNEKINVICNQGIPSPTQGIVINCETSSSETSDSFTYSENIMNETQDLANYSNTKHSETDDDVICCEMEYTKKRKKKYSNSSGTKKLRTSEKRKRKSSSQDPKTLESTRIYNAIVYTTRLEEMSILHKTIKHLDNSLVIKKILSESRPKFNNREQKSNITVRRTMSFKLLKNKLKQFKKKETVIDLTEKIDICDYEDLILTDVICPKKITTLNAEDTKNVTDVINLKKITTLNAEDTENIGISKKNNVVIVINNLFSNLCDIYITDWKCNIIEYHCTKLNDKNINQFDSSKIRLILDVCCWFRRQHKVESIWPRNECSFFRFLTTPHKCPLDQCTCCCKPKGQTTDVTLYKPDKFTDNFKTQSQEINKSLILFASTYKKPDTNQNTRHDTYPNRNNGSKRMYLFRETLQKGNYQNVNVVKNECFEIINNQDILRFFTDTYWRTVRQGCNLFRAGTMNASQAERLSVCCKWKRDSFLLAEYKACKISANALRFLRKPLFPNMCDQCKNETISPDTKLTPNLIIDNPKIEHTRTFVKPTLLKICNKSVASDVSLNIVKNLAYHILSELKMTHKTPPVESIKPPSTVKLKITCNEILGLDFDVDNVDYQIATDIVKKFAHNSFTVKENLKVVLNTPMKPTSNEEFQVIAQILLNTQNCLKLVHLPPGSVIDLVAKIIDHQRCLKSNVNVSKGNDGIGQPLGTCDNVDQNTVFDKYKKKNQSRTKIFTNENQTAINKVEKINEKYSSDNNFEGQGEVRVISNDHLHSAVFNIYDDQHASKLESYDCFANVVNCSKKCYAESFKSYLNVATDVNTVFPKISNVFSLHSSANQIQTQTNEPITSTSNDVSVNINTDVIPSTSNNYINISNLIAYPVQQVMLYDSITKTPQLGYLTPFPVNYFNKINQTQNINPMAFYGNNSNNAVLTPINQVTDGIFPVALQPVQENSILRDVLTGIPTSGRNIDERDLGNYSEVVVKKEEVDDDVLVLDSD